MKNLLVLFFVLPAAAGIAQDYDCLCVNDDCGDILSDFSIAGDQSEVCDGFEFFVVNNTVAPDIDQYIWYWGDGSYQVETSPVNVSHIYNIPDSLVCDDDKTTYQICLVIVRECGASEHSCHYTAKGVNVIHRPKAILDTDPQVCVNDPLTLTNASCNAETYTWDFGNGETATGPEPVYSYDTPGTYTVTLTVTNECGEDSTTKQIEVVGFPEAAFDLSLDPANGCEPVTATFEDLSNQWSNTCWSILPNDTTLWCFTDTLMNLCTDDISVLFKEPGLYDVTLTASNICGEVEESTTIEVLELPSLDLALPGVTCDEATICASDLIVASAGAISAYNWSCTGCDSSTGSGQSYCATFTQSGTMTLVAESPCGDLTETFDITIASTDPIVFGNNPTDICASAEPFFLEVGPPGGTCTGIGAAACAVSGNCEIDVSCLTPGNSYTVLYSAGSFDCPNEASFEFFVLEAEEVLIDDMILCEDSPSTALTVNQTGGVWSGQGITDTLNGLFDPTSVPPGEYEVTYQFTDANQCEVMGAGIVTVEAFPVIDLVDELDLCLSDVTIDLPAAALFSTNPLGGNSTWSGPGIVGPNGGFNGLSAGLTDGAYTVYVEYTLNECVVEDSLIVNLTTAPVLALLPVDTLVCISAGSLQLFANLQNGIWSGPGIDANSGIIDLQVAGGGVHTYFYQSAPNQPDCSQTASVAVEVIDLSSQVEAGGPISICAGPATYTLVPVNPDNGIWSGQGIIDSVQGTINLSQLTPDVPYVYSYCIESAQVESCSACDELIFTLQSNPVADFGFDGLPCLNEAITFVDNTQNGAATSWNFGDGNGSTQQNPAYSYGSPGTFTVTMISANGGGCQDTTQQQLVITTPPVNDFALDSLEGCAPFTVSVVNNSFGDPIAQVWYINGDTIPGPDPGLYVLDSIAADSLFTITLEVSNFCATIAQTEEVLVHPYPLVNFGINTDEGCSPLTIEFADVTLGDPDTYFWDLGNGQTFTGSEPPDQVYTTSDTAITVYTVTLTASNECGTGTISKEITVYPPNVEAFIELDTLGGCQPFTIVPASYSTPGASVSWCFYGPDGSVNCYNEQAPEVVLDVPGIHMIVLTAANCGADTDTAFVEILPAPDVSFTHPASVCRNEEVMFTNTSSNVTAYLWAFGNGDTSNLSSPVYTFDSAGIYTVTLTAFSLLNDCPATFSSQITVTGLPTADFSANTLSGCAPLSIQFSDESIGVDQYTWDFGDGSPLAFDPNPSHTFTEPGNYAVTLTVNDENDCFSDTTVVNVFVYELPEASFSFSGQQYCAGHDTLFLENNSVGADGHYWLFMGDTLFGDHPQIPLTTGGTFTIELVAQNLFGCTDSEIQLITVDDSPIAAYTPSIDAGCEDLTVAFDNQSQFGNTYFWNLGAGNTSTDEDPVFTYQEEGVYPITLIVTALNGCPGDTVQGAVTVWPEPFADFSFEKTNDCGAPAGVVFQNLSLDNQDNSWSFGDGIVSQETNPVHEYLASGVYSVGLIVENVFGCADTTAQEIDIYGQPEASAELVPSWGCEPLSVQLINNSTESQDFIWQIGSLPPITAQDTTLELPEGMYEVTLIAIYNEFCQDTLVFGQPIAVYRTPVADFTYEADELENILGDVQFENLSIDADRYFWDFGDSTYSTEASPYHEYDINRPVWVILSAFNDNGGALTCRDTIRKLIQPEWITTFFAHNAFSPDYGPPEVRVFRPVGIGLEDYEISVYSPQGNLVWRSTELENTRPSGFWDGTFQGKPVPQGDFVWVARITYVNGDRATVTGNVTVLR